MIYRINETWRVNTEWVAAVNVKTGEVRFGDGGSWMFQPVEAGRLSLAMEVADDCVEGV
jgi:hypothetical protein